MSTTYKPLGELVFIRIEEEVEESLPSGILIPTVSKPQNIATVYAAGPGKYVDGKLIPLEVKVGDKIAFNPRTAFPLGTLADGKRTFLIKESEILAVVETVSE